MAVFTRPLTEQLLHEPVALPDDPARQRGYIVNTYPDSDVVCVEWLNDDGTTTLELEDYRVSELLHREEN